MKLNFKSIILLLLVVLCGCASSSREIVSPGGIVTITNQSGEDLEVFVDGYRTTVVKAGTEQVIDRLISGKRVLTITGIETRASVNRTFELKVGEGEGWRVTPLSASSGRDGGQGKGCRLDVVNSTMETVSVVVNNSPGTVVAAGVRVRLDGIPTGTALVQATGAQSGLVRKADIPVRPDIIPTFTIMDSSGAVRFTNRSGRAAFVSADGIPVRQVENGKTALFAELPTGKVRFSALDVGRRLLGDFNVDVVRGKVIDVVINQPSGTLNVVSDLTFPVSIFADGVLLGTCPARGGAGFTGLVPGNNKLKAVGDRDNVLASTWLEITPQTNLWVISETSGTPLKAGTGAVEVENPSREKLELYVDGTLAGVIDPASKRVAMDLLPGDHSVAVVGQASRSLVTATVVVRDGARSRWKVAMPVATISVVNSSGESVNVYSDGRLLGHVESSATSSFPITQGEHRIEVTGAISMNGVSRTMVFPAGTTTLLPFAGPLVTVVATNVFTDQVEIRINDRLIGRLKPNERITVSDVQPGTLRLWAESIERPVSMTVMIDLAAGDAFDWNIAP